MGSGSYGGGGGGSGAGGGGGGGWGGGGGGRGYRFKLGRLVGRGASRGVTRKRVKKTFKGMPREYVETVFCSPLLDCAYRQLFIFSVEVFQNYRWDGIERRYKISGTEGCLKEWVDAVLERCNKGESNQKVIDITLVTLEEFLLEAMGGDPRVFGQASSEDVVNGIDKSVFDLTSNCFLKILLWQLLEAEPVANQPGPRKQLKETAKAIADGVIAAFKRDFLGVEQTTYPDLFRVVCENMDWFQRLLRS